MLASAMSTSSRGGRAAHAADPQKVISFGGEAAASASRGSTTSVADSRAAEKQSESAEKEAEKKEREIGRELQKMYDRVLEIIEAETVTHAVVSAEGIAELEGKPPGRRDPGAVAAIAKQIKMSPLYTFLPQVNPSRCPCYR